MASRAKLVGQVLALGLVAALLALLAWKVVEDETGGGSIVERVERGERPAAPELELDRLDRDGSLSLASLRGKGVVLNFWASWCIPCKEEAPLLEQAWRDHRDKGLVVLGVDAQDFREDARSFLELQDDQRARRCDGRARSGFDSGGVADQRRTCGL